MTDREADNHRQAPLGNGEAPPGSGVTTGSPTLVFATRNAGKLAELEALVAPLGLAVRGAAEIPGIPEVEEDGETFEHNAIKKAREVARASGLPALADDSGLEVDALGGAPGVHSARYSGPGATDARNNAALLEALAGVPAERRSAHFTCVMALAEPPPSAPPGQPDDEPAAGEPAAGELDVHLTRGRCDGVILDAPRGEGGFGYDPLFFVPEQGATFAELPRAVKNRISHRARALQAMRALLERRFDR
jgi:XTP/dITP diphosphohydrolase